MPFIENKNSKIYYTAVGNKKNKPLVFLTGALLDHTVWKYQIELFKKDYYVIAIDNRGCGKSDCPEYKYTTALLCKDVELILNMENIYDCYLAGFSMGGLLAQSLIERGNINIQKLILSNCSLGVGNKDIILPEKDVANMYLFSGALSDDDLVKNVLDFCFGPNCKKQNLNFYNQYYKKILPFTKAVSYQIGVILDNRPLIKDYAKVNIPILIFLGKDDPVTPIENKHVFKKYYPESTIVIYDGYHLTPYLHYNKVNMDILKFLKP